MKNKVFIQSLGCPKNLVDSEVMSGCLRAGGYQFVDAPEDADIMLVNTCGFINPAVIEGIDAILALSQIKEANPSCKLVVTGCMVQRYGEELRRELPEVDLFFVNILVYKYLILSKIHFLYQLVVILLVFHM